MNRILAIYLFLSSAIAVYEPIVLSAEPIGRTVRPDKYGVYLLDKENIDSGIRDLDSVLVVFYSPQCYSCKNLESELKKVVQILSSKGRVPRYLTIL